MQWYPHFLLYIKIAFSIDIMNRPTVTFLFQPWINKRLKRGKVHTSTLGSIFIELFSYFNNVLFIKSIYFEQVMPIELEIWLTIIWNPSHTRNSICNLKLSEANFRYFSRQPPEYLLRTINTNWNVSKHFSFCIDQVIVWEQCANFIHPIRVYIFLLKSQISSRDHQLVCRFVSIFF